MGSCACIASRDVCAGGSADCRCEASSAAPRTSSDYSRRIDYFRLPGDCAMRVLVAGATGAVGRFLIPELRRRGHEVFGTTRNLSKADVMTAGGARPVRMDWLDQ